MVLSYGLLSVGTQEQPDPEHLMDDFQRTDQDKYCARVCLSDDVVFSHVSFMCALCKC